MRYAMVLSAMLLVVAVPASADGDVTVTAVDLVYIHKGSDGACRAPNDRWIASSGPNLYAPYASLRIDDDCQPI